MAKIILQASFFKKKYTIDPLAITASEYGITNKFTLEVKPFDGYVIDAVDFTTGFFDPNISSITYSNTESVAGYSNFVKVEVVLAGGIPLKGKANVVVFVPVTGVAKTISNELTFIDETEQVEGITVFDRITGGVLKDSSISKTRHSKTYTVIGGAGESGVIMEKIFTADNGYYIVSPPVWKVKSRLKNNYSVTSREFYDDDGELFKKVYYIAYAFPTDKFVEKYKDKIIFS